MKKLMHLMMPVRSETTMLPRGKEAARSQAITLDLNQVPIDEALRLQPLPGSSATGDDDLFYMEWDIETAGLLEASLQASSPKGKPTKSSAAAAASSAASGGLDQGLPLEPNLSSGAAAHGNHLQHRFILPDADMMEAPVAMEQETFAVITRRMLLLLVDRSSLIPFWLSSSVSSTSAEHLPSI